MILLGSKPLSFKASRIAAKSATAGTPVKSCIRTRVGEKDISKLSLDSLISLHKLEIMTLVTDSPSSFLIKFSKSIFIELGIFDKSNP